MPVEREEINPSGSPSYTYGPRDKPYTPSRGDPDTIRDVEGWIDAHLPADAGDTSGGWVYHELASDLVHLDVHAVAPAADRPFWTLVTSGMSERPMAVPEHPDLDPVDVAYAELLVHLPPDWPGLGTRQFGKAPAEWSDERHYWPIRLLKTLARFPHEQDTWLGFGHTMGNGQPPEPYAPNTALSCVMLLPSVAMAPESHRLQTPSRTINFFALYPLYEAELDLKRREGSDALLDLFNKRGVSAVLNPHRPNACVPVTPPPRRGPFGRGK